MTPTPTPTITARQLEAGDVFELVGRMLTLVHTSVHDDGIYRLHVVDETNADHFLYLSGEQTVVHHRPVTIYPPATVIVDTSLDAAVFIRSPKGQWLNQWGGETSMDDAWVANSVATGDYRIVHQPSA